MPMLRKGVDNMERFTILKLENHKQENYFSLCIKDDKEDICFWIDCSLKKDDDYTCIDWEYNAYIFYTDNDNDMRLKDYQDNWENNGDELQDFIDNKTEEIINKLKEVR